METRTKDGVEEHRHIEYDYWHPIKRVHTPHHAHVHGFDPTQVIWAVDQDGIADIVNAIHFKQMHYINLFGEKIELNTYARWRGTEPGTPEWCKDVSIGEVTVLLTWRAGKLSVIDLRDYRSAVKIVHGHAHYERNTPLHDAKILLESGLAAAYIDRPDLVDAMHLLHVAGDDRHYDLVRLPSGGHIPVDILEEEYDVSWETLAKISLGKPRDGETFTCPVCNERSFYSGICQECEKEFDEFWWLGASAEEKEDMERMDEFYGKFITSRDARKKFEHGEILRLIKSGNWKACRYMRG